MVASVMVQEGYQDDNRYRHAEQPKQDTSTHDLCSLFSFDARAFRIRMQGRYALTLSEAGFHRCLVW